MTRTMQFTLAAACAALLMTSVASATPRLDTYVGVAWTEGISGFGTENGMTESVAPALSDAVADGFDNTFGTFSGTASANATYGTLGVASTADLLNGNNARASALAGAAFTDTFTFSGGTTGTSGTVNFVFDITGSSAVSGDGEVVVALAVFQDTTVDLPSLLAGLIFESVQVNGNTFGVNIPVDIIYDQPTELTFALGVFASVPPILTLVPGDYTGTADGTYDKTAEIVDITPVDPLEELGIGTGSGTNYLEIDSAVPEPTAFTLAILTLLPLARPARRWTRKRQAVQ